MNAVSSAPFALQDIGIAIDRLLGRRGQRELSQLLAKNVARLAKIATIAGGFIEGLV